MYIMCNGITLIGYRIKMRVCLTCIFLCILKWHMNIMYNYSFRIKKNKNNQITRIQESKNAKNNKKNRGI